MKLDHVDDIGTKWFKCEKNGHVSWKLQTVERKQYGETVQQLADTKRETNINEINEILSTTVKEDKPTKSITFLSYLLTYTKDNQVNLFYKSESARGKSYIAQEVAAYFPEEDVMIIGYSSKQAFFHIGTPVFEENEDDERKFSHYLVDLSRKIVIFLDQPTNALLERLRPLLSHDKKEYTSYITDRSQKYGLRTKKIVIKGFPTVVFCTPKMHTDQQEATRGFMLSPEATQEKLELSTRLVSVKEAHRSRFEKQIIDNEQRTWLKERIQMIKNVGIEDIDIADELEVWQRFRKMHQFLQPRHQRDYPRLIGLIKAHALLNCFTREKHPEEPKTITANEKDMEAGFSIYKQISESNELGLPPEIYEIYRQVIEPRLDDVGITKMDIMKAFYKKYHRTLSDRRLSKIILPQLKTTGLIMTETDPTDRRRIRIKKPFETEDNNDEI